MNKPICCKVDCENTSRHCIHHKERHPEDKSIHRKKVEKWELDLIFLTNKLLEVEDKIRERIDKGEDVTWRGKYPNPLEKAMNDIHDLFQSELELRDKQLREGIEKLLDKNMEDIMTNGEVVTGYARACNDIEELLGK